MTQDAHDRKHEEDHEVHVEAVEETDPLLEAYLKTEPLKGLTDAEVAERLLKFGTNEIPEKKSNKLLKFLSYFTGSISFLLEAALIVSAILGDWIDFGILLFVLVVNAIIGFHEEAKAESALDSLKNTLALKTRVFRDSKLIEVDCSALVPGDIIALRLGDIVPADCRLLGLGTSGEENNSSLLIDQAALTGESLPVNKKKGHTAYSSSIIKQGQMLAVVTKTGLNTYIGRAANLISITNDQGHFQKVINSIGNFLIIITVIMVIVIFLVTLFRDPEIPNDGSAMPKDDMGERVKIALEQVLVLTVAAIPVGLPTVMSVTMALGAKQLAQKKVIVKRLTAIEELASVSILCSDKTGTLTLNQLTLDKPYLAKVDSTPENLEGNGTSYTQEDLLLYAYIASEPGAQDAIELAVRKSARNTVTALKHSEAHSNEIPGYKVTSFVPFNPHSKYTEATVVETATGKITKCIKGAPQVIVRMCGGHSEANDAVFDFAKRGLRALGVAKATDPELKNFEMIGMISLLDPPRPDSGQTIQQCNNLGVDVKMITGDQQIIAKEVAHRLGMQRCILDAGKLTDSTLSEESQINRVEKADGFAQVIPEHKYRVVELLQKKGYLVGMTGDGVNDAPALKKANVGIAVEGCTDAARSAADIVLLAAGLSTIVDGIMVSRAIFQRMRSYAVYRIASTIHFLLFFFISILAYRFSLPNRLIILIAVLNDAATLVIAADNALISRRPDKWRLGQLLTLSFILGLMLTIISLGHYWVAHYVFRVDTGGTYNSKLGQYEYPILQTIMYLNISSCPHFVIFSTRLATWCWKSVPSALFTFAIIGTQIFAMFMSIFGIKELQATAIGWGWGLGVMGVSFLCLFVLDAVKVFVISNWSFELTAKLWPSPAQRKKLRDVIAKKERDLRIKQSVSKVRKIMWATIAIRLMKSKLRQKPANSAIQASPIMEETPNSDVSSLLAQARKLRETLRNRALENATIEEELAQEKEELLKQRLAPQKNNSLTVESSVQTKLPASRRASVWKSAPPEISTKTEPASTTKDPTPKLNTAQRKRGSSLAIRRMSSRLIAVDIYGANFSPPTVAELEELNITRARELSLESTLKTSPKFLKSLNFTVSKPLDFIPMLPEQAINAAEPSADTSITPETSNPVAPKKAVRPLLNMNQSTLFKDISLEENGIYVFIIDMMEPVLVPEEANGKFCSADCYIILKLESDDDTDMLKAKVWTWIGSQSEMDKKFCAATFAIGLRDLTGSISAVHREDEGEESDEFKALFEEDLMVLDISNATESGLYVTSKRRALPPRLYKVCGKQNIQLQLIPFHRSLIQSSFVFILLQKNEVYQWNGSQSSINHRKKASLFIDKLNGMERLNKATVIHVDEKNEPEAFWEMFREEEEQDPSWLEPEPLKVYCVGTELKQFLDEHLILVDDRLKHELLQSDQCYIIDAKVELYLWLGKKATTEIKDMASELMAKVILSCKRPKWMAVYRLNQGLETEHFKLRFSNWNYSNAAKKPITVKQSIKVDVRALYAPPPVIDMSAQKIEPMIEMSNAKLHTMMAFIYRDGKYVALDEVHKGHFFNRNTYVFLCIYRISDTPATTTPISDSSPLVMEKTNSPESLTDDELEKDDEMASEEDSDKNEDEDDEASEADHIEDSQESQTDDSDEKQSSSVKLKDDSEEPQYECISYFYEGQYANKKALTTFNIKTQKEMTTLMQQMYDCPVNVVHVDSNREPIALLAHLNNQIIIHRGSLFTEEHGDLIMYQLWIDRRCGTLRANEVIPSASNLVSNDIFLIMSKTGRSVVWIGRYAEEQMTTLLEFAKDIVRYRTETDVGLQKNSHDLELVRELSEDSQFWELFEEGAVERPHIIYSIIAPRFLRCSCSTGYFVVEEVIFYQKSDLLDDSCVILDPGMPQKCFVWVGSQASDVVQKLTFKSVEVWLENTSALSPMLSKRNSYLLKPSPTANLASNRSSKVDQFIDSITEVIERSSVSSESSNHRLSRSFRANESDPDGDVILVQQGKEPFEFKSYFKAWHNEADGLISDPREDYKRRLKQRLIDTKNSLEQAEPVNVNSVTESNFSKSD